MALEALAAEFAANPKVLMKLVLARIRSDGELRKIFHARHVLNTDRLRTGYQSMLKQTSRAAAATGASEAEAVRARSTAGNHQDSDNSDTDSSSACNSDEYDSDY